MSNELRQFLQAWLDWSDAMMAADRNNVSLHRVPNPAGFSMKDGLCICIDSYCNETGTPRSICRELSRAFKDEGLNTSYPFGETSYDIRMGNGNQYADENRRAWVKSKLGLEGATCKS